MVTTQNTSIEQDVISVENSESSESLEKEKAIAKTKMTLMSYMYEYAKVAGCHYEFKTWTRGTFEDLLNRRILALNKLTLEELRQVPLDDLIDLGFGIWSKESGLLLIPIYFVRAINQDEIVTAIDETTCKLSEVDYDVRYGFIGYGFKHPGIIKEKEEE